MRFEKTVRQAMLEDSLWPNIVSGFSGAPSVGKVEFFDNSGILLCELDFNDKEIVSTGTDKAILRLKSIDGSFILKGASIAAGTVTTFKIYGNDYSALGLGYILVGSVGTLTSSEDLRFNVVNWLDGTFISIENFDIIISNGV